MTAGLIRWRFHRGWAVWRINGCIEGIAIMVAQICAASMFLWGDAAQNLMHDGRSGCIGKISELARRPPVF